MKSNRIRIFYTQFVPARFRESLFFFRNKKYHAGLKAIWAAETKYSKQLRPFHETKSIFVHIPKTAGISVTRAIYGRNLISHASAYQLMQTIGKKAYDQYFSFAFVRNPFDRLYSAYTYLKRGGINDFDRTMFKPYRELGFEEFVMEHLPMIMKKDIFTEHSPVFRPQWVYVVNPKGQIMVNRIGRYENLETDFSEICSELGLKRTLSHINRSRLHDDFKGYFTTQMIDLVSKLYQKDLELFKYDFE